MNGLSEQFVVEARELIASAGDDLIALEREPGSAARIDAVFRAFHTLKGAAGVVDLPAMAHLMHAAEDLLAAVKAGHSTVTPQLIDRGLACLDQVARWVDAFEVHGALPSDAGDVARRLAAALQGAPTEDGNVDNSTGGTPEWALALADQARRNLSPGQLVAALSAVDYVPRPGCYFDGDDPVGLMRKVPELLALRIGLREPPPPLAEIDPFACNLRLTAIAAVERDTLATLFRLVPDQVRIVALPADWLAVAAADAAPLSPLVREMLAEQRRVLAAAVTDEDRAGRIGAAARVAANALTADGRADLAARVANAANSAHATAAPLMACLDAILSSSDPATDAETSSAAETFARGRMLRVDEARVDALVNLAGELTLLKNRFAHLAKMIDPAERDHAQGLRREVEALERLDRDIRDGVLRLRMVPVAQLFQSFPRLVRDIARKLDKQVELVSDGESVETDKAVIDLLFEPLLHLVRNALDHGIEPAAERRAGGKSDVARLTLRASQAGDRLVIEVIDDGRGIDPKAVRRRATERGLLSAAEIAALSDEQAIELVFAAGFSTAAEVSELSGRGVGMDAVRAATAGVGGRISLASKPGLGTTARLELPSRIATLRVMVVEAAGQRFGVPIEAVSKTLQLTPDRISRIKNNDGFVVDERVVPICALAELMQLPAPAPSPGRTRLVVLAETDGRVAGIEVEAIRDRFEGVVKPMTGVLAGARPFAGTMLLGDGTVLLVLDLKELVP